MQLSKTLGIVLTVLGAAVGVWAFTRVTSVMGQLHTWQPPFSTYETITVIGAAISIVLIILGIIALVRKPSGPAPSA